MLRELPDENKAHLFWIDLVRAVAVFQVVLIHLSFPIFYKDDALPSTYWVAANFYDSFSRMGVPLFFMVSGYLLLRKHEPSTVFFRKRLLKVGLPTLFWTVFYLFWSVDAYRNGTMAPLRVALSMLKTIYLGDVEIHLWFLYILIGIYLVVPLLRLLVSAASRKELLYFTLLWFIASPLLELAKRLTGLSSALVIPLVGGYIGYFLLGYILADVPLDRKGRIFAALGIGVSILITFFGTGILSQQGDSIDTFLYSYFSLPTVLASICGYLLLKDLGQNLGRFKTTLRVLSASSFGIYLIHILIIDLLRKGAFGFRLYSWMASPVYMIPVTALAVYLASFMIVFMLRNIPIIKMIVP